MAPKQPPLQPLSVQKKRPSSGALGSSSGLRKAHPRSQSAYPWPTDAKSSPNRRKLSVLSPRSTKDLCNKRIYVRGLCNDLVGGLARAMPCPHLHPGNEWVQLLAALCCGSSVLQCSQQFVRVQRHHTVIMVTYVKAYVSGQGHSARPDQQLHTKHPCNSHISIAYPVC